MHKIDNTISLIEIPWYFYILFLRYQVRSYENSMGGYESLFYTMYWVISTLMVATNVNELYWFTSENGQFRSLMHEIQARGLE